MAKPFFDRLGHKSRRRMCPLYVAGLIGPGDRKSVQPMAERLAPGDYDGPTGWPYCEKLMSLPGLRVVRGSAGFCPRLRDKRT